MTRPGPLGFEVVDFKDRTKRVQVQVPGPATILENDDLYPKIKGLKAIVLGSFGGVQAHQCWETSAQTQYRS